MPSSPDPSALVSGQIDGYCGYVTNQGVMLKTRGVEIYAMNAQDLGLPETTGTIYGREDFLAANRDLVVRFLKGAIDAYGWALNNPEQTAKLMVEKYGAPGLDYRGPAHRDQGKQAVHRVRARNGERPARARHAAVRQDHRCLSQGRHRQDGHEGGRSLRSILYRRRAVGLIAAAIIACRAISRLIKSPWCFMAVANR